jgi:hypothetical protein
MKSVDLWQNQDGTWTARIFDHTFTAKTREECVRWIHNQGETI